MFFFIFTEVSIDRNQDKKPEQKRKILKSELKKQKDRLVGSDGGNGNIFPLTQTTKVTTKKSTTPVEKTRDNQVLDKFL